MISIPTNLDYPTHRFTDETAGDPGRAPRQSPTRDPTRPGPSSPFHVGPCLFPRSKAAPPRPVPSHGPARLSPSLPVISLHLSPPSRPGPLIATRPVPSTPVISLPSFFLRSADTPGTWPTLSGWVSCCSSFYATELTCEIAPGLVSMCSRIVGLVIIIMAQDPRTLIQESYDNSEAIDTRGLGGTEVGTEDGVNWQLSWS